MEDKMLEHLFGDVEQGDAAEDRADDLKTLAGAGVMPRDEPPDQWHDEHPEPTEAEMAFGQRLGETIDIEDDEDNGGVS